jgi:ribonuclease HII
MARKAKNTDRLEHERALWSRGVRLVAGVDEAGRGPLAGPVVAAAVVLPSGWFHEGIPDVLQDLNDSKQLSAGERENFFTILTTHQQIVYSIASVDAATIDRINILQATHRAMNMALAGLIPKPHHVLVDGRPVKSMTLPNTALVKGDSLSYSIAAASVLAKVTRDRMMLEYDLRHPGYGFADHKGYGTPQHLEAIAKLGPCAIHRRSFAPLRNEIEAGKELFSRNQGGAPGPAQEPPPVQ